MLRLNEKYLGARVTSDEVTRASASYADVLARCQDGEERHAGSLGWLHVDDWASGDTIARIEDLSARLREGADTFVLIGVGGSNNASRAALCALGMKPADADKCVRAAESSLGDGATVEDLVKFALSK